MPTANGLLTIKEAAIILRITDDSLRRLCRLGSIPGASKIGGRWLINKERLGQSFNNAAVANG